MGFFRGRVIADINTHTSHICIAIRLVKHSYIRYEFIATYITKT